MAPESVGMAIQFETDELDAKLLTDANRALSEMDAAARVAWALKVLPETHIISSSFGTQAAVMLHLLTQHKPDIPVVLVDTGYLFAETYRFVDELCARLSINLVVYRATLSPAWQEARFGQRWNAGPEDLAAYNEMNKVEPMRRALADLGAKTWFAGLRRVQSQSRRTRPVVEFGHGTFKVYPLIDWSDRDVHKYLSAHELPYHPLWHQGYASIGDTHSTQPLGPEMSAEDTRFDGRQRECGLHIHGDGI